jgi:Planctomycete cytochrome C
MFAGSLGNGMIREVLSIKDRGSNLTMEFLKGKRSVWLVRVWLAGVCLLGLACPPRLASQTAPALIDYNREVHAILAARCLMCHSQEKRSGGLSLATYRDVLEGGRGGAAVKPGDSKASLLMRRISGETQPQMPIGGPPLGGTEIAVIGRGSIKARARRLGRRRPSRNGRRRFLSNARQCLNLSGGIGRRRSTASWPRIYCGMALPSLS